MRALLTFVCSLLLRIFFRRIDVSGREQVPVRGPVMFVLNHPNALIDPLFVLCHGGRRVSFLAKAPLFSMPFVGWFVRGFECLPVYRQQDGADPKQNREVLQRAARLLSSGNALALFPEGTSHGDPSLRPLRTGAARIALAATALGVLEGGEPVSIVPAGLHYERKWRFRSNALLVFGQPLAVPTVALDERFEPDRADVQALMDRLQVALKTVTLQAESHEILVLAETAERLLEAADRDADEVGPASMPLAQRVHRRKRLIEAYTRWRQHPGTEAIVARLRALEAELASLGLEPGSSLELRPRQLLVQLLRTALLFGLLMPLALPGLMVNTPTYHLVGAIAFRYSRTETDIAATVKLIAGALFFPSTWLLVAVLVGVVAGGLWGLVAFLACPVCSVAALLTSEQVGKLRERLRVSWRILARRELREALKRERAQLVSELRAVREPAASGMRESA